MQNKRRNYLGRKWEERRSADGAMQPIIFLALEVFGLTLIVYVIYRVSLYLAIAAGVAALFFFMTSSLPRYWRVIERQKKR